ncbi:hypothetical protein Tco_1346943 [Tanacetum coccineum]
MNNQPLPMAGKGYLYKSLDTPKGYGLAEWLISMKIRDILCDPQKKLKETVAFLKNMANPHIPLLRELSHAADSNDIKDYLSVLFQREVVEDLQKIEDYRRLSSELREAARMRDGYISELQMSDRFDEVAESIEIMRSMQLDDMEKAYRLLLMAREL